MNALDMDYTDRTQRLAAQRPLGLCTSPTTNDETHRSSPNPRRSAVTFTGLTADIHKIMGGRDAAPKFTSSAWRLIVILEMVGGRFSLAAPGPILRNVADPQNAMFLMPPNLSPTVLIEDLRYARYLDVQFQPERIVPLFREGQAPRLSERARLGFFDARIFGLARLFESECVREGRELPSFGDCMSVSLLTALACLPELGPPELMAGGLTPRQLRRATTFLEENLADPIRPSDLAAMLGFSRSHFCRAFKASTGLPPHAWQLAKRIERARELIIDGSHSLVDIALTTGFTDQPHFTRAFTRAVGSPPGQWRRQLSSMAA
jgi:AraC-like DNA-binding protein